MLSSLGAATTGSERALKTKKKTSKHRCNRSACSKTTPVPVRRAILACFASAVATRADRNVCPGANGFLSTIYGARPEPQDDKDLSFVWNCTRIHQPQHQPRRQNTHTRKFMECQHIFILGLILFSALPLSVVFDLTLLRLEEGVPRAKAFRSYHAATLSPRECSDPWPLRTFSLWAMALSPTRLVRGKVLTTFGYSRLGLGHVVRSHRGSVIIPVEASCLK